MSTQCLTASPRQRPDEEDKWVLQGYVLVGDLRSTQQHLQERSIMASYFEEHSSDSSSGDEERMNFLLKLARLLRRVLREQNVQLELPIEEMLTEHLTTPPASKEFIANLQTVIISGEKCPICLVEFDTDEMNKKLPCKHCFHADCIIPWLKKTNSCPVCRREFPTDNTAYEEYRKEVEMESDVDRVHRLEELHGSMFS